MKRESKLAGFTSGKWIRRSSRRALVRPFPVSFLTFLTILGSANALHGQATSLEFHRGSQSSATARATLSDVPVRVDKGFRLFVDIVQPTLARHNKRLEVVSLVPGDTMSFFTPTFLFRNPEKRHFTLADTSQTVNLWIDTQELGDSVTTRSTIDSLLTLTDESTPGGSLNPSAGIVANNTQLFGPTADSDMNGKVNILWYDIRDEYESNGQYIGGFVRPEDLTQETSSNNGEFVYLDTDPLLRVFGLQPAVASTLAGTLQSLIHLQKDPNESSFLSYGLFELASSANGFPPLGSEYLWFREEHAVPMFDFDGFPGDYQRSALFTNYLYNRFGSPLTQALVADTADGLESISNNLTTMGESIEDVVLDFHLANYANLTSQFPTFGYSSRRQNLFAFPGVQLDGSVATSAADTTTLGPGAVRYISLRNAEDVNSSITGNSAISAAIYFERKSGVKDVSTASVFSNLTEQFRELVFVLTNVDFETFASEDAITALDWSGPAIATINEVVDSGDLWLSQGNFISLDEGGRQANKFTIPDGHQLTAISVAPFYVNMFNANGQPIGSSSDPRDFSLVVRNAVNGLPGNEIGRKDFIDRRPFRFATSNNTVLDFQLNRVEDVSVFGSLSGDIFISLENTGSDGNHIVVALADESTVDAGFLFGDFTSPPSWSRLWDLTVNQISLEGTSIPIRAQFQKSADLVSVESQTPAARFSIFPNPTSGRIFFESPPSQSPNHTVNIVDLQGRIVRRVDVAANSGSGLISLDLSFAPAGVYFLWSNIHGNLGSAIVTN